MKLAATLELHAGGPGSGCHGANCGRPSSGGVNYVAHKTGGQGGSNAGGFYRGSDGVDRYVKFYRDAAQGRGEALANTLYRDLGLGAPKSTIFEHNGKDAFASEIIPGGKTLEHIGVTPDLAKKVLNGFAADVLVGNWDAVGLTYDNILVHGGDVHRIDNGGTFLKRAQGEDKPSGLLNQITEAKNLLNPDVNAEYSRLARKAGVRSVEDMASGFKQQVAKITTLQKESGGWEKYVSDRAPYITGTEKQKIVDMLNSRTKLLRQRADSL